MAGTKKTKDVFNAYAPRGFTLVELLVTITILAILIIAIVVLIDPGELFAKTRDTRRLADLASLRAALTFAIASGESIDFDGTNILNCADESSPAIFVSIPSTQTMHTPPTGWSWKQAPDSSVTKTDGTGWAPINFEALSGGSPLFNLPLDPRNENSGSARFFYSYACHRLNRKLELNAKLESKALGPASKDDKSLHDGGDAAGVYETGSSPTILPTSGVY